VTNSSLLSAGSAIGNHLWQTTIFAAAIWLATLILRNNPAQIRYSLWLAASLKFLLPFSLLISLGSFLPKSEKIAPPVMYPAIDLMGEPFSEVQSAAPVVLTQTPTLREQDASILPITLGGIWLCGLGTVLVIWYIRWHKLSLTLRRSRTASTGREIDLLRRLERAAGRRTPVRVLLSTEPLEPGIIGILRPVLLWPERLSDTLDDEHIEAILVHELTHVRRQDNLMAALHMLVEAAFWFHPLVWWIERQMVEERERACDEEVVRSGRRPDAYAESLLRACRYCVESPLRCVSGVTGAGLNRRIISIMTTKVIENLSVWRRLLLLSTSVTVVAVPLLFGEIKAMQKPSTGQGSVLPSASDEGPARSDAQAAPDNSIQASADRLAGTWQGTLHQGKDSRTVIKIVKGDDGGYRSIFYSIDESGNGVPATKTAFEGNIVKISILMNGGTYDGNLSPDGSSIVGMWSGQGQTPVPLNLARATQGTEWIIPAATPMPPPMDRNADPAFEVATIKPSKSDHIKRFLLSPRHFKGDNVSLEDLIVFSYGLHPKQLESAPAWAGPDKYDIEAQPDGEGRPSYDQWKIMVRKLLAERWKLRFHQEKKELPVYVLSAAPKGSKLTKSQGTPTGLPGLSYRGRVGGDISAVNASMADFINWMTRNVGLDRPIVDQTGLKERYDFTLDWTPDDSQFGGAGGTLAPAAEGGNSLPSLYVALQEQLGLKLTAQRALADVLVIDHVERPSEN
jgi:uncharacterized protein (TIGR03435 family)